MLDYNSWNLRNTVYPEGFLSVVGLESGVPWQRKGMDMEILRFMHNACIIMKSTL